MEKRTWCICLLMLAVLSALTIAALDLVSGHSAILTAVDSLSDNMNGTSNGQKAAMGSTAAAAAAAAAASAAPKGKGRGQNPPKKERDWRDWLREKLGLDGEGPSTAPDAGTKTPPPKKDPPKTESSDDDDNRDPFGQRRPPKRDWNTYEEKK